MDRDITFRKIAAGHYRNEETGVEITKVPRKRIGRNGYRVAGWSVTAPTLTDGVVGRSEVGFATTQGAAREPATIAVLDGRGRAAADFPEAVAEKIDRVVRAYDDTGRFEHAWRMIEAARRAWWAGNYDQARVFVREAENMFIRARFEQVAAAYIAASVEDIQRAVDSIDDEVGNLLTGDPRVTGPERTAIAAMMRGDYKQARVSAREAAAAYAEMVSKERLIMVSEIAAAIRDGRSGPTLNGLHLRVWPDTNIVNISGSRRDLTRADVDAVRAALTEIGFTESTSWVATEGMSWLSSGTQSVSIRYREGV